MTQRILALVSLATLSFALPAQRNLDFEAGADSNTVPGWFLPVRGFAMELQPRAKPTKVKPAGMCGSG